MANNNNNANFAWNIADHLRGTYKATDYGKIVIPFTILRRMDCILEDTKQDVLDALKKVIEEGKENIENIALLNAAKHPFYNKSQFTLTTLLNDSANIATNLKEYIDGFSDNVKDIFLRFRLEEQINNLDENDLLYLTVQKYASADFHPQTISNHEMGLLFEELIRKFAEDSAADNGEFFTPRDAITLLVQLLFAEDAEKIVADGAPIINIYDPTAGTGGMLSVASEWVEELNSEAEVNLFGQELNPESYAICKSDMIAKNQNIDNIALGNTLTSDKHSSRKFDYVISNPPYGSKWEKEKEAVEAEHKEKGFDGRFGPGLPASSDGQLLFLLHAVSKLNPVDYEGKGGGRAGVILNGSSLFSGDAGSGASNIRRWLFEQDYVDAIVALPTNMFYSTGIATYMWLIDTNKPVKRRGKVQLINGTDLFTKMRKSLGGKTRELSDDNIAKIVDIYKTGQNNDLFDQTLVKTFNTEDFGFRVVTVERPLRKKYVWSAEVEQLLTNHANYQKLNEDKKQTLLAFAVSSLQGDVFDSYNAVDNGITAKAKEVGLKFTATDKKLLIEAMETANLGEGEISYDNKGNIIADPTLRDTETIPLSEDVEEYITREVLPFAPDAVVDESKTKIGYEIPFNRHFYKAEAQRPLADIQAELKTTIAHISELLGA
jgi:type I restriction enzyme M protein